MAQIIKDFKTIEEYIYLVEYNPEDLKPKSCSNCGCQNIWINGTYDRAINKRNKNKDSSEAVSILRLKCSRCGSHYSILPSIIPLLRWYLWCMQQRALDLVLKGKSFYAVANIIGIDRKTVSRWYYWLKDKFELISSLVNSITTEFIQLCSMNDFYLSIFKWRDLSKLSRFLHDNDLLVPY